MSLPRLAGRARVPGDKSIAHRALILALLAKDDSFLSGLPDGADVAATQDCIQRLGARVEPEGRGLRVTPPRRLMEDVELDARNSGTTARLLAGALAGRACPARIVGDESLSRRPMRRLAEPLRRLGAGVQLTGETLPIRLGRARLHGAEWDAQVPSAQVKSAFLLAALGADGESTHREAVPTRDHLERLLPLFGVRVDCEEGAVRLQGGQRPSGAGIRVPGDPSSAAFLVSAAVLLPGSDVVVEDVVLNPTRTGFVDVLSRMGADVVAEVDAGLSARHEPVGLLRARGSTLRGERGSSLRGVRVTAAEIPRLVDEVPLLVLAAAFAEGESRFEGLGELRLKESDRLTGLVRLLADLGAEARLEADDTLFVSGGTRSSAHAGGAQPRACRPDAAGDHRMAMLHAILALRVPGVETQPDPCVAVSWPGFHDALAALVVTG